MGTSAKLLSRKDRPSLPILRLGDDGQPAYVKVDSPIYKIDAKGKPALEWMDVTELSSSKLRSMRAHTVLASELRGKYPADGYVGRIFLIKKYRPEAGKQYAKFSIKELRPIQPPSQSSVHEKQDESSTDLKQGRENLAVGKASTNSIDPLTLSYDEYRKTPLWQKIKRRVLKRDGKRCLRCGGEARVVHHRSYEDEVKLGNNDTKLASVCEGCHRIIHFDESGKQRPINDWDSVLFEQDKRTNFPEVRIDRRRNRYRQVHPDEWPRMTDRQRSAWKSECQRQFQLWRLYQYQASDNEKAIEVFRRDLRESHGMDDQSINAELTQLRKRYSKRSMGPVANSKATNSRAESGEAVARSSRSLR